MNWIAMLLTLAIGIIALIVGISLANSIDLFIKWAVNNNWESWQITIAIMFPGIVAWAVLNGLAKRHKK